MTRLLPQGAEQLSQEIGAEHARPDQGPDGDGGGDAADAAGDDEGLKIEEDLAFHRLVFELADNARLARAFDDLSFELRLCITLITRTHETPESIAASHWRLLEALKSGDPQRCRDEVDYHIGVARDSVIERLAEHAAVSRG